MTKEEKIKIYYDNPKYCELCGKQIQYDGLISLQNQLKKRFCDYICSNTYVSRNSQKLSKKSKKIGIYCIENKTNKKKYIGQSTDIEDRLSHHKSNIKHGHSLVKKIREEMSVLNFTVDDFNFYILEECSSKELDDKEKFYIEKYNTYIDEHGYNEDLGGRYNQIRSKKHSERLSETKKKQFSDKKSDFYKRFLIGQDKTKKSVLQIDNYGKIVKEWTKGALEISDSLGIPIHNIYNAIEVLHKTSGFYWIKKEDYSQELVDNMIKKRSKEKVFQYSFNGDLVNEWASAHEAKLNINIDDKGIGSACKGQCLQFKGYIWSYTQLTKEQVLEKVYKIPKYIITRNTPDKEVM